MTLAPITNAALLIKPTEKLIHFFKSIKSNKSVPDNIVACGKGKQTSSSVVISDANYTLTNVDYKFIESLTLPTCSSSLPQLSSNGSTINCNSFLTVKDVHWLHKYLENQRSAGENVYLHEIMEGCEIVIPTNAEIPRNPVLEKRCEKLRAQQANREYRAMTKNIDNIRKQLPEDTISYQMKQMNRQLIAIGQFIVSVLAGFAFGFIGIELIIGNLDFGFRLLLGIICALVIALAELYFLAKKLNEDLILEMSVEERTKKAKMHLD